MTQPQTKPQSIADRKLQAEADAALAQMFGYFTREDVARADSQEDTRRAA